MSGLCFSVGGYSHNWRLGSHFRSTFTWTNVPRSVLMSTLRCDQSYILFPSVSPLGTYAHRITTPSTCTPLLSQMDAGMPFDVHSSSAVSREAEEGREVGLGLGETCKMVCTRLCHDACPPALVGMTTTAALVGASVTG